MATARKQYKFQSADPSIHEITDLENVGTVLETTSKILWGITVDNTANGSASYVKLWNNASPTVGTTAPDICLLCPASVKRTYMFPEGITFGTAMTIACVTTAGTAGTTNPTSAVNVDVIAE